MGTLKTTIDMVQYVGSQRVQDLKHLVTHWEYNLNMFPMK